MVTLGSIAVLEGDETQRDVRAAIIAPALRAGEV